MAMSNENSEVSPFNAQQTTPLLNDQYEDTEPFALSLEAGTGEPDKDANEDRNPPVLLTKDDSDVSHAEIEEADGRSQSRLIYRMTSSFLVPLTDQTGSCGNIVTGLLSLTLVGGAIGLIMPRDSALKSPWYRIVSSVVGYIYFLSWSVSFYPQVILNFRRKSTTGLSNDFSVLNVVGFACYATYTCFFYWSNAIKGEYKQRNGEDSEITVQSNDVAFAVHALVLCAVQVGQISIYGGFRMQPLAMFVKLGMFFGAVIILAYAALILLQVGPGNGLLWLDFLYLLSFVKVAISVVKYIPQVILNIRRESTVGWNIWNIILDFTGGMLSIMQLIGDSADMGDWSGIIGNPAKFALGFVSIIFDIIFFLQHYFLYPDHADEQLEDNTGEPLLPSNEGRP
uniref:Cystinosin n=1 Tax=Trieres chinensis TaxID=1514140 RepID=A0A7S1Z196_TRICV